MKCNSLHTRLYLAVAAMLLGSPISADDDFIYQTIAVNHQAVPGLPGVLIEDFVLSPVIADDSKVLVRESYSPSRCKR